MSCSTYVWRLGRVYGSTSVVITTSRVYLIAALAYAWSFANMISVEWHDMLDLFWVESEAFEDEMRMEQLGEQNFRRES